MNKTESNKTQLSKVIMTPFLMVILGVCMLIGFSSCSEKSQPVKDTGKMKQEPNSLQPIAKTEQKSSQPAPEPDTIGKQQPVEPNKAHKQPSPDLPWGREVNGLRAAIEFLPEKESFAIGDTLRTLVHIQNVSSRPINKVEAMGQSFWGHSVLTYADGNGPALAEVNWQQPWRSPPDRMIEPGDSLTFLGAEIIIRPFYPDGTYPPRNRPNIVYFFPGRYFLSFKLDCSKKLTLETGRHNLVIEPNENFE
jgi:hypothetical protein